MFRSLITLFSFFVLCSVQGLAITYTTTTATNSEPLDWDDGASWVGGVVPVLNNFDNHIINLNHDIIRTGSLTVLYVDIITADNKTFTVNGNFVDDQDIGSHTSGANAVWNITGNLDLSNTNNFTTGAGTINVGGNLITGGNTKVRVDGSLDITGSIALASSSHIDGTGFVYWATLTIGPSSYVGFCFLPSWAGTGHIGLVFGGYINGDGYVHWGTASVGSGYIGSCYVAAWDAPPIPSNSGVHLIDCSESLPVELLSFSSDCTKEGVLIDWGTATETDNDFFEIQKAVGSFDFVTIGEVDGGGTSKTLSSYSYLDNRLVTGLTVYYRLRQVDFDGEYEYSKVIVSNCEALDKGFSIYPTVSSGEYTLTFNNKTEFIQIQLINELGQVMKVVNHTNTDGSSELKFELNGFSSGVYYAKVLLHNQYEVAKLIKR